MPKEAEEYTLWPEFLAAAESAFRPALRTTALAILKELDNRVRTSESTTDMASHIVHTYQNREWVTRPAADQKVWGSGPGLANWTDVIHGGAYSRAAGYSFPHWSLDGDLLTHHAGHWFDALYFAVPLRGNFEVESELSYLGRRSPRLS